MKKFNVAIAVVVLVLALVSAVFSGFLFAKRCQLMDGWKKFAIEINSTAKELDKDSVASADALAKKLNVDTLSTRNYDQLSGKLSQLHRRSAQIVAERNDLVDTLRGIASQLNVKDIPSVAEMRSLDTYVESRKKVADAVKDSINNRDEIYRELVGVANSELNVTLSSSKLRDGDKSALSPLTKALRDNSTKVDTYEKTLGEISTLVGANNGEVNGSDSAKKVCDAVYSYCNTTKKLLKDLEESKETIARLKKDGTSKESMISEQKSTLEQNKVTIRGYKQALGYDDDDVDAPLPWKDGSMESRRQCVGEVSIVNERYGYVCFNIGSQTTIGQKIGKKTIQINPMVKIGDEVIIARGALEDRNSKFIARVKLLDVGADCSIANIPAGDDIEIKTGDIVYLADAR
ncbi:MAG: hypothetical protein MJ025_02265 [Victivallaceae bacterium]|nr:hypothetical protein [Victivallaceae bacterium]